MCFFNLNFYYNLKLFNGLNIGNRLVKKGICINIWCLRRKKEDLERKEAKKEAQQELIKVESGMGLEELRKELREKGKEACGSFFEYISSLSGKRFSVSIPKDLNFEDF